MLPTLRLKVQFAIAAVITQQLPAATATCSLSQVGNTLVKSYRNGYEAWGSTSFDSDVFDDVDGPNRQWLVQDMQVLFRPTIHH